MHTLPKDFYLQNDVAQIARDLPGKVIVTRFNGQYTAARIVETEAYAGKLDKASHAFNGRRTNRTETMFAEGGVAYVYLCYGIHHLFNIVTNQKDIPDAVLIRGVEPLDGLEYMMKRCNKPAMDAAVGRGPGNAGKALGFTTSHNGLSLLSKELFIADDGFQTPELMVSKRIGVAYAGNHANWLYRFFINNHPQVTKHIFNHSARALV